VARLWRWILFSIVVVVLTSLMIFPVFVLLRTIVLMVCGDITRVSCSIFLECEFLTKIRGRSPRQWSMETGKNAIVDAPRDPPAMSKAQNSKITTDGPSATCEVKGSVHRLRDRGRWSNVGDSILLLRRNAGFLFHNYYHDVARHLLFLYSQ
jgi:hypothetical protein